MTTTESVDLGSKADAIAADLADAVEQSGNEVVLTYWRAELPYSADSIPLCTELATPNGIVSFIVDRHARYWMCCERDRNSVGSAMRIIEDMDCAPLIAVAARFLAGANGYA